MHDIAYLKISIYMHFGNYCYLIHADIYYSYVPLYVLNYQICLSVNTY